MAKKHAHRRMNEKTNCTNTYQSTNSTPQIQDGSVSTTRESVERPSSQESSSGALESGNMMVVPESCAIEPEKEILAEAPAWRSIVV